ncbi:E3 ubiquitin-protein ligase mind-bomb [Bienertia sinuspersici]
MAAMNETNEVMEARIHMQSQQLKMQSQQLQMQSKQMEGLQFQLQQVTSLLTKFGVMMNNPQNDSSHRGISCQNNNVASAQVPEASSEYTDSDSDSIEWDSD